MHPDCMKCLVLQVDRLLTKHKVDLSTAKRVTDRFNSFVIDPANSGVSAPEAACFMHRLLKRVTQKGDLYEKEKKDYNQLMLDFEAHTRQIIHQSESPFQTALRYALAGNIIDFGPPRAFDVFSALSAAANKVPAIDHSALLYEALKRASAVLYLGDNAGEIVLDKLFIETIDHPNLYFATRGGNIINDITLEDAVSVGMDKVAKVISNGYDAPSTMLSRCSDEFRRVFDSADLIISKGQGNLEGLIGNRKKPIFFLLMVKCYVIGEILGTEEKNTVVYYNQKIMNA